jgi:hypothetical protein
MHFAAERGIFASRRLKIRARLRKPPADHTGEYQPFIKSQFALLN